MPSDVSEVRSEILPEQIVSAFVAMLDDAPPRDDPAELEQLAATVLVPLEQPEMPREVASAVLEAIEARRDADAAGVLAALAVVAAEPLAARARAGAQRAGAGRRGTRPGGPGPATSGPVAVAAQRPRAVPVGGPAPGRVSGGSRSGGRPVARRLHLRTGGV
jgi:hypothetical protein